MTMPIAPAVLISAALVLFSYPDRLMAGMRMPPRAATVAGPEPEIAAKKHATMTQTIAVPCLV